MLKKKLCPVFLSAAAFSIFLFFSCGSAPVPQPQPEEPVEEEGEESVAIAVAVPKKKTFFSSVKKIDLDAVEIGSPHSLRLAYNSLHKSVESDYNDAERTLINVIGAFMDIAWKAESFEITVPAILVPNQYTGAVDSAMKGIYDLSTDSSDFLSALIPSLAILSSEKTSEYYDIAEKALEKALSFRSDSVIANYLMGVLCYNMGRMEDALKYLNAANGKYTSPTKEIYHAIAKTYYKAGNSDLALSLGEQLLKNNSQDTELLELCANSAWKLNDLEKTEAYIVRILLLEPDNAEYVLFRAKILMQKEDYIRASSLLDVCARKNQTPREYYILRAILQKDWNKNYTIASETISKALELYPDDAETLLLAAEISSLTGKPVNGMTAMDITDRILAKDPSNSKAMEISIEEFFKAEKYQQAYALSSRMVSAPMEGVSRSVLYNHIDICLAVRKTAEASGIAGRLYNENPSDEKACMAYIKVLVQSGQSAAASQLIARLLPDSKPTLKSFLYYERSFLQSSEDSVLADLRSSLTANPRNKDSLYRLYQIYYNKKDWRRAQYYLKQVVALDPSNTTWVRQNAELDRLLGR